MSDTLNDGWSTADTKLSIGDVFTIEGEYWPLTWCEKLTNVWRWIRRRPFVARRLRPFQITHVV